MFPGYDPDRKPPYSQVVYLEIKGKKYVTTYYVCNGYGGSLSITSDSLKRLEGVEADEERNT